MILIKYQAICILGLVQITTAYTTGYGLTDTTVTPASTVSTASTMDYNGLHTTGLHIIDTTTTTTTTTTATTTRATGPIIAQNDITFKPTSKVIPTFTKTCSEESNFPTGALSRNRRIIQGVPADNSEWPWLVRLKMGENGRSCGATIVGDRYLLSASFCCQSRGTNTNLTAVVGNGRDTFSLDIDQVAVHEKYGDASDGSRLNQAVCLLKTAQDMSFLRNTQIACMPKAKPVPGAACWTAGYGVTHLSRSRASRRLMQTGVNVMSNDYCRSKSGKSRRMRSYSRLQPDEFCAGEIDHDGDGLIDAGTDSCRGDSGGPLICDIDGRPTVTGIINWGIGCGGRGATGVYVDVNYHYDWIEEHVRQFGK